MLRGANWGGGGLPVWQTRACQENIGHMQDDLPRGAVTSLLYFSFCPLVRIDRAATEYYYLGFLSRAAIIRQIDLVKTHCGRTH